MAQSLTLNDIIKAQLWTADAEQASVNTFHFKVTGISGATPDLDEFLAQFMTAVAITYKALLSEQCHLDGGFAQIVFPLPLFVGVLSTSGAGNGVAAGAGASRQTAGLISWKTPLAGPGGRGRTYIPFPSAGDSELKGQPTDDYVTRLTNFVIAISGFATVNHAGGGSATLAHGLKKKNSGTFTEYTGFTANQKWATQKRRGTYGRVNTTPFT